MRSRDYNRSQAEKHKKKVKKYYTCSNPKNKREVGIASKTKKSCSCWMCGNPRKYKGEKTKQEKLMEIKLDEDISIR